MAAKQDLRVIKTKRNIQQSFIRLLQKKDFSSITVQNILEEALINRSTFYKYYNSKYELAEVLIAEIMQRFDLLLETGLQNRAEPAFLFKNMDCLAREFYADRQTVLALWRVHAEGVNLYGDMEALMKRKFQKFLAANQSPDDNIDFQTSIMAALILTAFKYLLESSSKYSVKELNMQAAKLFGKHLITG